MRAFIMFMVVASSTANYKRVHYRANAAKSNQIANRLHVPRSLEE